MKRKELLKNLSILFAIIFCFSFLLLFLFWWIYPYATSDQQQPYKVLDTKVRQGEIMRYVMVYCKHTDVTPTVKRQFIDGLIYSMPESTAALQKGCGRIINSVEIPKSLPAGEYYLKATVSFQMNPIRTITNEYRTEKFIVTK